MSSINKRFTRVVTSFKKVMSDALVNVNYTLIAA